MWSDTSECQFRCLNSNNNLNDKQNVLVYSFESETNNLNERMRFNGKFKLKRQQNSCDFLLKIDEINGLNDNQLKNDLIENQLRFGYEQGSLLGLCSSNQDSVESLNIKRALLSAIQTSQQQTQLNETDSNGDCMTSYSLLNKRYSKLTIQKTKQLSSCSNRQSIVGPIKFLAAKHYDLKLSNQMMVAPIFNEQMECVQIVDKNVIESTECKEKQTFVSAEKVQSKLKLKLIQTQNQVQNDKWV